MRLTILSTTTALLATFIGACQPAAEIGPTGPDLVTLHGPLSQYDRGAMQAGEEPVFASYGINFERALGLSASELAGFDLVTVETDFPLGGDQRSFRGPRLRDVLAFAGANNRSVRVTALDGYQRDIEADRYQAHDVILALYQDGRPLGIGGRGPAMLVWPRGADPALADMNDDDWIFGIFTIEVLPD
ncbi:molybdopterin-dependent oxidoreductase [uncultured Maricaulis sp.]|uniref:molybdopterin-dependent oxidoreductase n=1 Tax=uncultured Maricaulis sp. TaxID=174710 RepID=UPI00262E695B|nr:molybdopterin-dependent oxidoreductase [uncultured Maricaulis sp.]